MTVPPQEPASRSVAAFAEGLRILAEHCWTDGMERQAFMEAEHEVIYFSGTSSLSAKSPEGELLDSLGFQYDLDYECWTWFT